MLSLMFSSALQCKWGHVISFSIETCCGQCFLLFQYKYDVGTSKLCSLFSSSSAEPSSVDHLGVALGYVAHLVHQLSRVLLIPLQYQVKPYGSRSHICDHISDEALIDNIKE